MTNHDYFKPGIAAIALAILFPIYWVYVISAGLDDFETAYRQDVMSLSGFDLLFVIICVLEVYIYLSLRKALNSQLNSGGMSIVLIIMAAIISLLHLTVLIDLVLAFSGHHILPATVEAIIGFGLLVSLVLMCVYALVCIILGCLLIFKVSSVLLKAFGILMILICLFGLTLILSWLNIVLFPAALILLAVYFLKEPDSIELI